jgi:hypothetical protein
MDTAWPSDDAVRLRAYELWQSAGCPTGRPDEFWHRARAELSEDDAAYDTVIEDSFPASDPPSHSGVTGPRSDV